MEDLDKNGTAETDNMDFTYPESSNQYDQSHELLCSPGRPAQKQHQIRSPSITPRRYAGRKRTSSGNFKDHAFDSLNENIARIEAVISFPNDDCDLPTSKMTSKIERLLARAQFDGIDLEQNQRNTFHTELTKSLATERGTIPSSRRRKHKRQISLLPWRDESKFDATIR